MYLFSQHLTRQQTCSLDGDKTKMQIKLCYSVIGTQAKDCDSQVPSNKINFQNYQKDKTQVNAIEG